MVTMIMNVLILIALVVYCVMLSKESKVDKEVKMEIVEMNKLLIEQNKLLREQNDNLNKALFIVCSKSVIDELKNK